MSQFSHSNSENYELKVYECKDPHHQSCNSKTPCNDLLVDFVNELNNKTELSSQIKPNQPMTINVLTNESPS